VPTSRDVSDDRRKVVRTDRESGQRNSSVRRKIVGAAAGLVGATVGALYEAPSGTEGGRSR